MSGVYGTIRPANVNPETDVEIFYYYRPTRSTMSDNFASGFKKLESKYLVPAQYIENPGDVAGVPLLGVFNLKLPLDRFGKAGFYTLYIRPKEYRTHLVDVSTLVDFPSIRGVVIDRREIDGEIDLTGYRIEYFDENQQRTDKVRLITSSNPCKPVWVTVTDSYSNPKRYQYTNSTSNILFCTVTPSTVGSYSPNTAPDIGTGIPDKDLVAISNTKFNPVMMEIEMVEHDAETITNMLEGDQIRDRDNAVITTYNKDKEIYQQYDYYTLKSSLGEPLYDVKVKRENIDTDQEYDNIIK